MNEHPWPPVAHRPSPRSDSIRRQANRIMHKRQGARLQALRGVQDFLAEHTAVLPTVNDSGIYRKFDDLMVDIQRLIVDQSGADYTAQIKTRTIHTLRRALVRDHMKPIARISAAELPDTPALAPLRMPQGSLSLQRLIAYSTGMVKTATAHADVFIGAGLPADFSARFTAATNALVQASLDRSRARGDRGGATKGLEVKLARARKLVGVLDAFVTTALQDDVARLTDWNIVKRVHRGTRPTAAESIAGQGIADIIGK